MTKETVTIDLPAERVYSILLNYFKRERMKVKRSVEPSLIEVVAGSLLSSNPYNVKMKMTPENGKTSIELNFDFAKMYALCLMALAFVFFIFGLLFGPEGYALLIVMETIGLAIGVPRTTNATKKKFIDKVTDFLRHAEQAKS